MTANLQNVLGVVGLIIGSLLTLASAKQTPVKNVSTDTVLAVDSSIDQQSKTIALLQNQVDQLKENEQALKAENERLGKELIKAHLGSPSQGPSVTPKQRPTSSEDYFTGHGRLGAGGCGLGLRARQGNSQGTYASAGGGGYGVFGLAKKPRRLRNILPRNWGK